MVQQNNFPNACTLQVCSKYALIISQHSTSERPHIKWFSIGLHYFFLHVTR